MFTGIVEELGEVTAVENLGDASRFRLRGPVVTRKNAGGSRNGDTARNAAVIWTVTATAQMAGLNLLTWLTAYLDECGRNGGKPLAGPDLNRFLPWNASPDDLRTWAQPPPSPMPSITRPASVSATFRSRSTSSCRETQFCVAVL